MSTSTRVDDVSTLLRVSHFASLAHQHQRRKSPSSPAYIQHPLDVARRIANPPSSLASREGGAPIQVLCAALCHDILEDTEVSEQELQEEVGEEVLKIGELELLLSQFPLRNELLFDFRSWSIQSIANTACCGG